MYVVVVYYPLANVLRVRSEVAQVWSLVSERIGATICPKVREKTVGLSLMVHHQIFSSEKVGDTFVCELESRLYDP